MRMKTFLMAASFCIVTVSGLSQGVAVRSGNGLATNMTHYGTLTVHGPQTNDSYMNIKGPITNYGDDVVKGTLRGAGVGAITLTVSNATTLGGNFLAPNLSAITDGSGHDNVNLINTNGSLVISSLGSNVTVSASNQVEILSDGQVSIRSGGIPGGISMDSAGNIIITADANNIFSGSLTFDAAGPISFLKTPYGLGGYTNNIPQEVTNIIGGIVGTVSLSQFGAKGDGTTDDTAAVQAWANFITSTNCIGVIPPAVNEYKLTSEIDFTNTAKIIAGGGGSVYAPGDFPKTHCRFNQTSRGSNGFVFNSYADNITIDGSLFITNSAANNYTNRDSCGFLYTGSVGSHASSISRIGAANFGRGIYIVDLAAAQVSSSALQNNLIGIEATNILNTGNYPLTVKGSILSGNYETQFKSASTNMPITIEGCIITPPTVTPAATAIASFSRNLTLINDQFLPIGGTNLIAQTGGTLTIVNCSSLINGGVNYYPIVATNAFIFMTGTLGMSNNLDGSSVFLFGSASRLAPIPDEQITQDDGSGTLTTNIASLASGAINGASIIAGTLPRTAADSSWYSSTNFAWLTNGFTVGQIPVLESIDANGNLKFKGTNPPTGGGSIPNNLVTNFGLATVVVPNNFDVTNSSISSDARIAISGSGLVVPSGTDPVNLVTFLSKTNNSFVHTMLNADWFNANSGIALSSGALLIQSNGVSGATGWFYMDGAHGFHMGQGSSELLTLDADGTVTANGGAVSYIPTNAAPIFTSNNITASLPFGITNRLSGRAEPVIEYYMIDGASGVPIMTLSNETSGVKLTMSRGSLASLSITNFATLPVTSTNVIWRLRDESAGSGASVGLITNWLIGL